MVPISPAELLATIKQQWAEVTVVQREPDLVLKVQAGQLLELARWLRQSPALDFNYLLFVTAVDYRDYLEVVYCLRSLSKGYQLLLKVPVPDQNPEVPSVTPIWPAANWDERETYDMFGIKFTGHPNLQRILLPDDWEGHPLRKSYPLRKRPPLVFEDC